MDNKQREKEDKCSSVRGLRGTASHIIREKAVMF